jgi:hypothetical protein
MQIHSQLIPTAATLPRIKSTRTISKPKVPLLFFYELVYPVKIFKLNLLIFFSLCPEVVLNQQTEFDWTGTGKTE